MPKGEYSLLSFGYKELQDPGVRPGVKNTDRIAGIEFRINGEGVETTVTDSLENHRFVLIGTANMSTQD
jgi:hypothetical protein